MFEKSKLFKWSCLQNLDFYLTPLLRSLCLIISFCRRYVSCKYHISNNEYPIYQKHSIYWMVAITKVVFLRIKLIVARACFSLPRQGRLGVFVNCFLQLETYLNSLNELYKCYPVWTCLTWCNMCFVVVIGCDWVFAKLD